MTSRIKEAPVTMSMTSFVSNTPCRVRREFVETHSTQRQINSRRTITRLLGIILFVYLFISKNMLCSINLIKLRQNINIHGLPETAGYINTSYADKCIGLNDEQKVCVTINIIHYVILSLLLGPGKGAEYWNQFVCASVVSLQPMLQRFSPSAHHSQSGSGR